VHGLVPDVPAKSSEQRFDELFAGIRLPVRVRLQDLGLSLVALHQVAYFVRYLSHAPSRLHVAQSIGRVLSALNQTINELPVARARAGPNVARRSPLPGRVRSERVVVLLTLTGDRPDRTQTARGRKTARNSQQRLVLATTASDPRFRRSGAVFAGHGVWRD
jgi:hypothetical protein